ncbi:hypothetical protein ACQ4PT_037403 [Festuca glaucescens]
MVPAAVQQQVLLLDFMLEEIFARLPRKAFHRCRCLSRAWASKLSSDDSIDRNLAARGKMRLDYDDLMKSLEDVMCDKINWVDGEWTSTMKVCLLKLWNMYEDERDTRIHENVEYATKNYQLVLEKWELEKRNLELHKQLGNTLEHVAELTNHDLELEKAMRVKAEQQVAILKEEKRKLEYCVSDLFNAGHVQKDKLKKIAEILKE